MIDHFFRTVTTQEGLTQDILLPMELLKPGGALEDTFDDHAETDSATLNIVAHNLANTEACLSHGYFRIDIAYYRQHWWDE
jgi:hypothetical protein